MGWKSATYEAILATFRARHDSKHVRFSVDFHFQWAQLFRMAKKPFYKKNQKYFAEAIHRFWKPIEEARCTTPAGRVVELGVFPLESTDKIFVALLVLSPKRVPLTGTVEWFTDPSRALLRYQDIRRDSPYTL